MIEQAFRRVFVRALSVSGKSEADVLSKYGRWCEILPAFENS